MNEALGYPLRGEHAEKALLAVWICVLVHVLVLPFVALVPLAGYVVSVFAAAAKRDPPPFFDREVPRRTLGGIGLTLAYVAGPLAVALVTFRLLVETNRTPIGSDAVVILAGSTAILFVLATSVYLLPIALANYARAGSFRAGFSGIAAVAGHAAYFVGWCSGIVLLLVGIGLSSALIEMGGVVLVAGSFVATYTILVAVRRISRGYADATR